MSRRAASRQSKAELRIASRAAGAPADAGTGSAAKTNCHATSAAHAASQHGATAALARAQELFAGGGFAAPEATHIHRPLLETHAADYDPNVASRIAAGEARSAARRRAERRAGDRGAHVGSRVEE